ncbi:MAG: serine/threonine protein kinase [Planctomycetaceae bacterium]|jgi:outer membrane protein assembly factor BamB|nr:serine/threonine protein kinase [Planctomycetaceae bacterium]MDP7277120.1 PQQ-binding-like beta-propeller repeat protein [Planctomycetaceae bacterium]
MHRQQRHCRTSTGLSLLLVLLLAWPSAAADWPRFRGSAGIGVSAETKVPTSWSDTTNLKWKLALPGKGFSSPIIVGNKVLVTCYSGQANALRPSDSLKRHLVCVDRQQGKVVWSKAVASAVRESRGASFGTQHGFASHTPVSDGERVYVLFGKTGVLVFDLEGKLAWKAAVGTGASRFGSAASPIVYKNLLIVAASAESKSIWAFDRKTGKPVWKNDSTNLGLDRSYATPVIAKNAMGRDELVLSVTYETWSLDPATGKLNWYAETEVDTNACPSVVVHENVAYVIGGRSPGGRAAIRLGGSGDVTKTHVLWSKTGGSYVASPVFHGGHLYWLNDRGIAFCVDAKSGEEVLKKRVGGQFYASMLLLNNQLVAVSRFGGTRILEASPKMTQVALNKLSDTSDFSGSPAIADGQMILRSDEFLYCIEGK